MLDRLSPNKTRTNIDLFYDLCNIPIVTTFPLNFESFHNLNRRKLRKSAGSIVFSEYMKKKVRGGTVVYHGAESFVPFSASKKEARSRFSLPQEKY